VIVQDVSDPSFATLKPRIDRAVSATDTATIAQQVKAALEEALRENRLDLPAPLVAPRADTYARRLLHRDPGGRYTVVVMTWGPGQRTALHDHAGIWCVECVVDGEMDVVQYDLLAEEVAGYRFEPRGCITAGRGTAGCLIPPFEYHTLANHHPDRSSITLHVYGGEMSYCHAFEPADDGLYRKVRRELSYHN
jgi:predicted metal-dependent enzyme (double-stranded beta helix superfamily)